MSLLLSQAEILRLQVRAKYGQSPFLEVEDRQRSAITCSSAGGLCTSLKELPPKRKVAFTGRTPSNSIVTVSYQTQGQLLVLEVEGKQRTAITCWSAGGLYTSLEVLRILAGYICRGEIRDLRHASLVSHYRTLCKAVFGHLLPERNYS